MSRSGPCHAFLLFAAAWAVSVPAAADTPAHAPTGPDHPPPGYHDVKLSGGGVVRVADQPSSQMHDSSDAPDNSPYDPEKADFNKSSSFASKTFDTGHSFLSQNNAAEEARNGKSFLTKPYATTGYTGYGRTFQTAAYRDASHPDAGLTKSYVLPASTVPGADQTFNTGKKSEFQDKPALIGQTAPKIDPFAAPDSLTEKTFYDPAMTKVKHDPYAAANGLDVTRLTNLPNRSLTIDEVRALINHDQAPDLSSRPEAPSKALNDPNWTPPEALPPAPDDLPVKPGPTTEGQAGELPSPGMMSQPAQNSPSR